MPQPAPESLSAYTDTLEFMRRALLARGADGTALWNASIDGALVVGQWWPDAPPRVMRTALCRLLLDERSPVTFAQLFKLYGPEVAGGVQLLTPPTARYYRLTRLYSMLGRVERSLRLIQAADLVARGRSVSPDIAQAAKAEAAKYSVALFGSVATPADAGRRAPSEADTDWAPGMAAATALRDLIEG